MLCHFPIFIIDQTQKISGICLIFRKMQAFFQALCCSGKVPHLCLFQTQIVIAVGYLSVFAAISIIVYFRLFP